LIPSEDNYVEWFTCSARFHFLREGYAFLSFALDQVGETGFPAGSLLAAGSVHVGVRFVLPLAPRTSRGEVSYDADADLHDRLSAEENWLFYALPTFADVLDQQLTHQKVLFAAVAETEIDPERGLVPVRTRDFKELVAGLEDRSVGREVPPDTSVREFLAKASAPPVSMHLVLNRAHKVVFALKSIAGHRKEG